MNDKMLIMPFLCICNFIFSQNWINHTIIRNDNDYVSYKDTISLQEDTPLYIKERIQLFFDKIETDKYDMEYQQRNCIFKVSYSKDIDIYIAKNRLFHRINYYFFCYNKSNNKFSDSPYCINGNWIENDEAGFQNKLSTPPLFSVKNIIKNKESIILKERVHNSNSYNAVISHYLEIDNNMNFIVLFHIEDTYLYNSPEIDKNNTYIIHRTYNDGKVDCNLSINGNEEMNIGSFEIDIDSEFEMIKNKVFLNSDYIDYLVTGSG
ncbi:MAG: hypothetical protein LBH82_04455, partial [Bacteroidales bacterium]|nr:hypothetical protein [Bacteroidales bacterium]